MQELIKNFGINPYLLVAQIINFLIILYVLKRFAYKPIFALLENRRKMIEESRSNAQKAEEALQNATEREREILRKAQKEAQKILADAKLQSDTIISEANISGQKQVEKLLKDASEQITKDRLQTEKELSLHVAALATSFLKKSLTGLVSEKDQESLLKKAEKNLSNMTK